MFHIGKKGRAYSKTDSELARIYCPRLDNGFLKSLRPEVEAALHSIESSADGKPPVPSVILFQECAFWGSKGQQHGKVLEVIENIRKKLPSSPQIVVAFAIPTINYGRLFDGDLEGSTNFYNMGYLFTRYWQSFSPKRAMSNGDETLILSTPGASREAWMKRTECLRQKNAPFLGARLEIPGKKYCIEMQYRICLDVLEKEPEKSQNMLLAVSASGIQKKRIASARNKWMGIAMNDNSTIPQGFPEPFKTNCMQCFSYGQNGVGISIRLEYLDYLSSLPNF